MQASDDQRGVEATKDGAKEHAEVARDASLDDGGYGAAQGPAYGAEDEVRGHDTE